MEIILGLPWEAAKTCRFDWKSNKPGTLHMKVFMGRCGALHSLFHSPFPSAPSDLSFSGLRKLCGFGTLLQRSLQFLFWGETLPPQHCNDNSTAAHRTIIIIIISQNAAMISRVMVVGLIFLISIYFVVCLQFFISSHGKQRYNCSQKALSNWIRGHCEKYTNRRLSDKKT